MIRTNYAEYSQPHIARCLDSHRTPCDDARMHPTESQRDRDATIDAHGVICPNTRGIGQMPQTLTPKEVALRFGTSPKKLRKFLRSDAKAKGAESPGKGSRWAIQASTLKTLQKRFDAWNATQGANAPEAPKPTRTRTKPASTPTVPETVETPDAPETGNEDEATE